MKTTKKLNKAQKTERRFFNCKLSEYGLKFDENPKIGMKLKTSKFQKHIFVVWDLL